MHYVDLWTGLAKGYAARSLYLAISILFFVTIVNWFFRKKLFDLGFRSLKELLAYPLEAGVENLLIL